MDFIKPSKDSSCWKMADEIEKMAAFVWCKTAMKDGGHLVSSPCTRPNMNSMKLVIPLHFIS